MKQSTLTQPDRIPLPHGAILASAGIFGLGADRLLFGTEAVGVNFPLLFALLAAAMWATARVAGIRVQREGLLWPAVGLILVSGVAVRASGGLQLLAILAAALAFALPALRAGAGWLRGSGVSDLLEAVVGAVLSAAVGSFRLLGGATDRRLPAILRGLFFAAPLLLLFGILFIAADRVVADFVSDLIEGPLDVWIPHLVVIGGLTWLSAGYLTGLVRGTSVRGVIASRIPRPSIGITEAVIVLTLIDLLFAAFVGVQFRYLFGGAVLVEVTPGLTYAEYAREGFGQLFAASALVLPLLLLCDWLLARRSGRDETLFRVLGGIQIALLLVIIASAFQRVGAYEATYGLTRSRFIGSMALGWLALLNLGFAATVLSGRRYLFAAPMLVSGFALVGGLLLLNPDARIARSNLERAGSAEVDVAYLGSLGADAVPTLLQGLDGLNAADRCTLSRALLDRWAEEGVRDWRSWNRATRQAQRQVQGAAEVLRGHVAAGGGCAEPVAGSPGGEATEPAVVTAAP